MEILVHLLMAACLLAALPVAVVLARSWFESVKGAQWAASDLGFRPFDVGRSIDVTRLLDRADIVLAHG